MLILLKSIESYLCLSLEWICLVSDYQLAHAHENILGPQVKLGSVLLESKSSIDLHIFVNRAIFKIIDDVLAWQDLNVITGHRDFTIGPCSWQTPQLFGCFNHLLGDSRKA
jgi:hypothetical protein